MKPTSVLTAHEMSITLSRTNFAEFHALYYAYVLDGISNEQRLIYIGACPLVRVFEMPDAYMNTKWVELIQPSTLLTLEIIRTGTAIDISNERFHILRTLPVRPVCNEFGTMISRERSRILCEQTGQIFATATEASKVMEISQSQLSNHLNGKSGHKTVKGFTFKRIKAI